MLRSGGALAYVAVSMVTVSLEISVSSDYELSSPSFCPNIISGCVTTPGIDIDGVIYVDHVLIDVGDVWGV
eukprot:9183073-Ditylum_brightwellii.AAC.1